MSNKVEIRLDQEPSAVVDAAIKQVAQRDVYQRGGALVDVVREARREDGIVRPTGAPRIRMLPRARLREELGNAADFSKPQMVKGVVIYRPVPVPKDVAEAVEARGQWRHIRPLNGVCGWPTIRPDGSLVQKPGYDPATALLMTPTVSVSVPSRPTLQDAQDAIRTLLDVVCDFPFAAEEHKAAWLAALLTVAARFAIEGPVPMTLIDANSRGAGKTLLADVIGEIVTGDPLARRSAPDDAAEWRKTMLAIALAADPVVLIDNVTRMLRSDSLDAVLTGTTFRERVLGRNEELVLPVRTAFLCTANNAQLATDLVRRSLCVRIESPEERPERRQGFRYPRLLEHVRKNRSRLLTAALTIVRSYVVAGRPHVDMQPMGSYEAWSDVVRAPLIWAGLPDPGATQEDLREAADQETDTALQLAEAWHATLGAVPVTVGEILRRSQVPTGEALSEALEHLCDVQPGKSPNKRQVGNRLRRLRGRVVGGYVFERQGKKGKQGASWTVRPRRFKGDSTDSGDSTLNPHAREKRVVEIEPETESLEFQSHPSTRRYDEEGLAIQAEGCHALL